MLSLNLIVALMIEIVIGTLERKSQSVKHFSRSILMVSGVVLMLVVLMHSINSPSGENFLIVKSIFS